MRRLFHWMSIVLLGMSARIAWSEEASPAPPPIPRLETYMMASQVDTLLSTEEGLERALRAFQEIGITKIYLESLRCGYQSNLDILRRARDFFQNHQIEVSGGITTAAGEGFGVASNETPLWLNYQDAKTLEDLAEHLNRAAPLFNEIMIDDFLATDDTTPASVEAKGERSWPEYRMMLMNTVAVRAIRAPARLSNPTVRFILKFPQWYDRFHLFGYDVSTAPRLFERIWVGTETRNPETPRYGYVMPTQGYINYRWLSTLAKGKTGGAWYDFGDCTPEVYRMQAYQSVLAGARELVLFEAGSLIEKHPCLEGLLPRRDALLALGSLLENRVPVGLHAYKPPHSDGSDPEGAANLYVYDYLAMFGLAPLPVSQIPVQTSCVFLPRQAAADPEILPRISTLLDKGASVILTPDFLARFNDTDLLIQAGFTEPVHLGQPPLEISRFWTGGEEFACEPGAVQLRPIPMPRLAKILCAGIAGNRQVPILTKHPMGKGFLYVLNIQTFSHEEFAPGKEMFLPPRPLTLRNWPEAVVTRLRHEFLPHYGLRIEGPNNLGVYLYEDGLIVLANFSDQPVQWVVRDARGEAARYHLVEQFPHVPPTRLENQAAYTVAAVAPWELLVMRRDGGN
ncbi:MAG: hypothetical protein HPY51_20590 [Candidatus Omnitrophica bacterium]|nr:hypothetical protein [Candidatus Omnitrophota bacterium]